MYESLAERRARDRRHDAIRSGGRRDNDLWGRPHQDLPLSGVFPAMVTPMTDDLQVNLDLMAIHAKGLIAQGCQGVSVLGVVGEAASFSTQERMAVLDGLVARGVQPYQILIGTGCSALSDTVELTRHAVDVGVRGVLILPPFYANGVTDDGLFHYFSEVFDRVGSPDLQAYLYHFPQVAGLALSESLIARLLDRYPTVLRGIKDSSNRLDFMLRMIRAFPGFSVFTGSDDLLQPLMEAGGAGAITAVGNLLPETSLSVFNDWEFGQARDSHRQLTIIRKVISAYPLTAALKEILGHYYQTSNWTNMRPPLTRLTAVQSADLLDTMHDVGFSAS